MASVQIHEDYKPSNFPLLSELEAWYDEERARRYEAIIGQPVLFEAIGISVVVLYFGTIIFLKSWMKDRPAYKLQAPLFVWNVVLSIYSLVSVVRTLPEMVSLLEGESGWNGVACNPRHRENSVAIWSIIYKWSKLLEMGDTVFILLRKQKLIFLHWYHHLVTFIYVWISAIEHTSVSRLFMIMNCMVHTAMYGYYASRVWRIRLPRAVNISITSLQLVQMLVAVWLCLYVTIEKVSGRVCHTSTGILAYSLVMYMSYVVLFANFFAKTYINSPKTRSSLSDTSSKALVKNGLHDVAHRNMNQINEDFSKVKKDL